MTATARGGETYAWHSFSTGASPVSVTMKAGTAEDTVVFSDANPSYEATSRQLQRPREVINRRQGELLREPGI